MKDEVSLLIWGGFFLSRRRKESAMRQSMLKHDRSADQHEATAPALASASALSLEALFQQMHSSPSGLTNEEARKRLSQYGPNEPTTVRRGATLQQMLVFVANPLVLILIVASIITAILGEVLNSSIIILMVSLSVALNFFQTFRSQRAVERLRAGVALTSTVLRDGAWVELPRAVLVPGDVIRLSAGDMVPADARLIETNALHVQQAALTGESMPVEKTDAPDSRENLSAIERSNLCFLGTSVESVSATAVIVSTAAISPSRYCGQLGNREKAPA